MIRNVLLSAIVLGSLVASSPPASAQTAEPPEFGTEAVDTDPLSDRVGLVDSSQGVWHLRGLNGAINSFFFGNPGDVPFVGDWNCDGIDTPGLYRQSDGFVYLRNTNTQGVADIRFFFGNPGDFPLAGDFNNDGCDTVSIYRPSESRIYVINALGANDGGLGAADFSYVFGNPGDKPFVGDFNGDGVDTVGLHRESTGFVYFRQSHTQGIADSEFFFGDPGDRLVAGDWGVIDDVDSPAIFRPANSTFFFRYTNTQGVAEETMQFGIPLWLPVAGSWESGLRITGGLPDAIVGFGYSQQLHIEGGVPPYTVTKTTGPVWASVTSTGIVQGNPTAAHIGSMLLEVTVTDLVGSQAHAQIPLTVQDGCNGNVGGLPDIQCLALVALFRNTSGGGWTDKTGWLSGDPCTWSHVGCTGPNVTSLTMDENNLVGTLPAELVNLTGLTQLDLSDNLLSGAIPAGLFGITTLQTVDLDRNNLSGGIPAFTVPLPGLTRLNLGSNALGGTIPESMNGTNLPAIQELALDENQIQGAIPNPQFFTMHTLTSISLNQNLLSGPTNGFVSGNFPALTVLDLAENQFTGTIFGAELGTLTGLTVLDLSENLLTGSIPVELTNLGMLTSLGLGNNDLEGAIPGGFYEISFPNIPTTPGALTLSGNLCLTAMGLELAWVSARDPLWDDGCP